MSKIVDDLLPPTDNAASAASAPQVDPIPRSTVERPTGLTRKRIGLSSSKLGVDVSRLIEAGWYCHWINDVPGRVENLLDIGYVFVLPHEIGTTSSRASPSADGSQRVSRRVGVKEDGTELVAYLMKTSQEFRRENEEFDQLPCDKIDAQIRAGIIKQKAGDNSSVDDPESATKFYRLEKMYSNPRR